jgi:hypothetical protein
MKKARIMLTAIAIFGVFGGALAFKAAKYGSFVYSTTAAGLPATDRVVNYTLTPAPLVPTTTGYYTTIYNATAPFTTIYSKL